MVYDKEWRVGIHPRAIQDVNHDAKADLVGFGPDGVYISESEGTGYPSPTRVLSAFGADTWSSSTVRTLADVDGDGDMDIVGFGANSVLVALKTANGYMSPTAWSTNYTSGWTNADFVRLLGDVDGDGKADIVGIDGWGAYVSTAQTAGFSASSMWVREFSVTKGWNASHVRILADLDGDGLADLIGFGSDGVHTAMSNGKRFIDAKKALSAFGNSAGWQIGTHIRTVANLNGDRYLDIVGIGANGVTVALGKAGGFESPALWSAELGTNTGWDPAKHVRAIADVDGDGYDDIVGIKDDQVSIAHNSGHNFEALTPTTVPDADFFTANHGWNSAKHPRFLADVDGDRQLELVGFFNDAVYWTRLIPKNEFPADWTTPTCDAAQLAPPAPSFCAGPWQYTKANRCVSKSSLCASVCVQNGSCELWENGYTLKTKLESPSIYGNTRSCSQLCWPDGSCNDAVCDGTISQPTSACQTAASQRAIEESTKVNNEVMLEASFNSSDEQLARRNAALQGVRATPQYAVGTFNKKTSPGIGATKKTWDEHWVCSLSVTSAFAAMGANDACPCAQYDSGSCEHDCGEPISAFTEPGELRPSGPGIANEKCLTYDSNLPPTIENVQNKFNELLEAKKTVVPDTVSANDFDIAITNRLKLMYELWGEKLTYTGSSTDQWHKAEALYRSNPDVNPSCGSVQAPPTPPSCEADSVGASYGDLVRCERLAKPHASEGVASLAASECQATLSVYLDLKSSPVDDAACDGTTLRTIAATNATQLMSKQFGTMASAPTSLGELVRQLWLYDG